MSVLAAAVTDMVIIEPFLIKLAETRPKVVQALRERGTRTCRLIRESQPAHDPFLLKYGFKRRFVLEFDFDSNRTIVVASELEASLVESLVQKMSPAEYGDYITVPELRECEFDTPIDSPKAALVLEGSPEEWGLVAPTETSQGNTA